MENIINKIKLIIYTIKLFICRRWGKILAVLVIPVLVFGLLSSVKLIGGEIGGIIGVVVLLGWGVVAGVLSVFGTKEWKVVAALQAVEWLLLFVAGGIITKNVNLVPEVVIVVSIVVSGSFFVSKIIKDDPKFIIFVIATLILWIVLRAVVKANMLNSVIVTMFVDILIDKIYRYHVECEEICLLRKLGENKFNKEYFDIYYNGKIIFYRVLYYVVCASVFLYEKNCMIRRVAGYLWKEDKSCTNTNLIQYISKDLKDFGVTFIIFIILMIIVGLTHYFVAINQKCGKKYFRSIKNIHKLVREKKNNFESYTQREEAIILE